MFLTRTHWIAGVGALVVLPWTTSAQVSTRNSQLGQQSQPAQGIMQSQQFPGQSAPLSAGQPQQFPGQPGASPAGQLQQFPGQPAPSSAGRPQPAPTQSFDSFRGLPQLAPGQTFVPQAGVFQPAPGQSNLSGAGQSSMALTQFDSSLIRQARLGRMFLVPPDLSGQQGTPLSVAPTQPLAIQPVLPGASLPGTSVFVPAAASQANLGVNTAAPLQSSIISIPGAVRGDTLAPVMPTVSVGAGPNTFNRVAPGPTDNALVSPRTDTTNANVVQPLTSPVMTLNSQVARNLFDGLGAVNLQNVQVQAVANAADVLNASQVQALMQSVGGNTRTGLTAQALAAQLRQSRLLGPNEVVVGFQDGTVYTAIPLVRP